MGNIFFCCLGVGERSNVPPTETETTPLQPHPPPVNQPASASYQKLCLDSEPYPHQDPGGYSPPPSPATMSEPPYDHQPHLWMPPPSEKAVTVRNDTNLKKETLRLEPDPENPGRLLVAFTFDSLVSGRITVVFFAKEDAEFQLTATKEDTLPPITFDFEKGLGQKFIQPSETGVDFSVFEDSELYKEAEPNTYPLAIKMEAAPQEGKSGSMQITLVRYIVKEKGEIKPSVIKQIIWLNGSSYELQDIYGIGDTVDEDVTKECVICFSEARQMTVLPCRHMCMCGGCAKELRFQTNLCPVCRQPAERLLEIHHFT